MGIALSELTIHIFLKNGPSFSIGIKRKSFIYLPYLLLMIHFCNRRRLQLIIFGLTDHQRRKQTETEMISKTNINRPVPRHVQCVRCTRASDFLGPSATANRTSSQSRGIQKASNQMWSS